MKGRLHLIPAPLGDTAPENVIARPTLDLLKKIDHFVVEEVRTARRYLSASGLKGSIEALRFYELNEHTERKDIESYIDILMAGNDVALISEAGLPAVADPGAYLVELAHKNNIIVNPHPGPSSIFMALMASGFNGQNFAFTGYLPVKPDERRKAIKELEKRVKSFDQTQIFIETPYRNDKLLSDLISTCDLNTKLCIAVNITLDDQNIISKSIHEWKNSNFNIGKRPAVFLIY